MGISRIFGLSVLWGSLLAAGCGTSPVLGTGYLALSLHWPQSGFQTLVIPAATERIDVRIEAAGIPDLQAVLRRDGQAQTRWEQALPAGDKRVVARALAADGSVLAAAEARVTVVVGQRAQAVLDLQPLPVASPQPSAATGNPDTPGASVSPGDPADPTPSPGPTLSPAPQASASPAADPSPTPVPTSSPRSGGGGGGGGGGGSNAPVIVSLTADPQTLQGLGAATRVVAVATDSGGNDTLGPTDYTWSCLETDSSNTQELNPACEGAAFNSSIGSEVYWQAPSTATVTPEADGLRYYRLTLTVANGGGSRSEDILITVPISAGTASSTGGQNQ